MDLEGPNQESDGEDTPRKSRLVWICCGIGGLLVIVGVTLFLVLLGGGPDEDERIRRELLARVEQSKAIFSATTRDRLLSDVIDESMERSYYDIANDAASHISMPMIRRGMYKRIAEQCVLERGKKSAKSCIGGK